MRLINLLMAISDTFLFISSYFFYSLKLCRLMGQMRPQQHKSNLLQNIVQ